ncbi:ribosomal protein S18-alanine N-acetyltransferase [Reinekea marinisedimentorum]|uniref:Ribosomal-protein-alanine acetyltransferase n=1 Tax=Reinekea marinisedimentorum TaxID=230495 RepID=A0A4R3I4C3_9GAMM|nr:ribosomal protein S18-alanine N-acetyltransferase [Reinekea marinisedimentorum]TCS40440.1 ribosomal-protein-alanine acetyltransferase [Reinekea marinisedimentorum]
MSNTAVKTQQAEIHFAAATEAHLDALVELENALFTVDRIHRRSFKRWLKSHDTLFQVVLADEQLVGYGLVLCNRGTKLARLYSIAVSPQVQGRGIGARLIEHLEQLALDQQRLFMRLEVARSNSAAYQLYLKMGYRVFGEYHDYYENHEDAIRMQKTIYTAPANEIARALPWYQQTTEFTCGPASLMMAMNGYEGAPKASQELELDIWREATTIFMTSGHGGTHPFGLAISARRRGFNVNVLVNTEKPLFVDGVRSAHKKEIIQSVHERFLETAQAEGVNIQYETPTLAGITEAMNRGETVLVLISTYRMDKKKTPHWVVVTHVNDRCIFVHDPDVSDDLLPVDSQHVPIALEDFDKMTAFGKEKLRTAIVIGR